MTNQQMRTYWRVKLIETVGGTTLEGWVRFVPALTAVEAKAKALAFIKKRTPGANPTPVMAEQELQVPINPTIQIRHLDDKDGLVVP